MNSPTIKLRWETGHAPVYQTEHSAGADLRSRVELLIEPGQVVSVPTGVWIDQEKSRPNIGGIADVVPELQIRARSGLAFRNAICLANGVGTIDADFPDEICVLLINLGKQAFVIKKGDRIAQIVLSLTQRISGLSSGAKRTGGFGSTGI